MAGGALRGVICTVAVSLSALMALPVSAEAVLQGFNGRIVLASGRDGGDAQAKLYLRTITSSVGAGMTGEPVAATAGQHRHPTWSPDRTKIAYARGDSSCTTDCDIFVLDLTTPGAAPQNITNSATVTEDRPAWSPDGTRIAYETELTAGSGQTDILVVPAPGSAVTPINLTNTPAAFEGKPAWTPGSETIFYHTGNPAVANSFDIVGEPATGGTVSPIAANPLLSEFQPSISPDGTEMCFTRGEGFTDVNTAEVIVSLANGGAQTPLLLNAAADADYNCTWSPDGQKIAWVQGDFGTGNLVMANSDNLGGGFDTLESSPAFDGNPDWAPDGRPTCDPATVSTAFNTAVSIPLSCLDTGPAYERTDVTEVAANDAGPANGTLGTVQQGDPSTVTYTPNAGFSGTDSFEIFGRDALSSGPRSTVTINVAAAPDGGGGGGGGGGGDTPPDNDIEFGKPKLNKKKGTAKLPVEIPGPGELELSGKGLKPVTKQAGGPGTVRLKVTPRGKIANKLDDKGKTKVKPKVTFTPTGGTANTESRKLKLKLK